MLPEEKKLSLKELSFIEKGAKNENSRVAPSENVPYTLNCKMDWIISYKQKEYHSTLSIGATQLAQKW